MKTVRSSASYDDCSGLVDIGGRRLYIECHGKGEPTVVMEAGSDGVNDTWLAIRDTVATFTHVCTYDRANRGRSDPAPKPRTASDMAADLAALLDNAPLSGPYVLVGWSFGGLIVRLFTAHHLHDVAGMVLLESTHPDQITRSASIWPPRDKETQVVRQLREWVTMIDSETHPEGIILGKSLCEVGSASVAGGLGSMPLVVLSRGTSIRSDFSPLQPDLAAKLDAAWLELQRDLARLSLNGIHQVATQSGHNIPGEEPELVVETIRRIVSTIRTQR